MKNCSAKINEIQKRIMLASLCGDAALFIAFISSENYGTPIYATRQQTDEEM